MTACKTWLRLGLRAVAVGGCLGVGYGAIGGAVSALTANGIATAVTGGKGVSDPAQLALITAATTLLSGAAAGLLGQNAYGAAAAAQNETLNNTCAHACGLLAAAGAIVGGAMAAGASVPADVATGGLNVALTPAEVAAGSAAGAAAGGSIGSKIDDWLAAQGGATLNSDETSDTASTGGNANGEDKPSLLDEKGEQHILDGDATGGGHRPGTGNPGKSEFPADWSDEKIKGEISDVATDPKATRTPGRGGRTIVQGTRDGIDITVVVEPPSKGGRIVTGFPTNVPRNPK